MESKATCNHDSADDFHLRLQSRRIWLVAAVYVAGLLDQLPSSISESPNKQKTSRWPLAPLQITFSAASLPHANRRHLAAGAAALAFYEREHGRW